MNITQVSVFLENKSGRLADVTKTLADGSINIRAATIADTADFGILRMVVDNPLSALKLLREKGFTAKETDIFAIEVSDYPGGLAKVMELFNETGVNIEYLYSSLEGSNKKAVVIFKLNNQEHGTKIIKEHNLSVVTSF